MKKIVLIAVASLCASNAMALSSYNSEAMTCSAVHDKIARDGAVVLKHPSSKIGSLDVYDRYVSNDAGCIEWGAMSKSSVPTSDDPHCKVQACSGLTGKGHNKHI